LGSVRARDESGNHLNVTIFQAVLEVVLAFLVVRKPGAHGIGMEGHLFDVQSPLQVVRITRHNRERASFAPLELEYQMGKATVLPFINVPFVRYLDAN